MKPERIVLLILIVNFICALIYLLFGLLRKKSRARRGKTVQMFFLMLICPAAGVLFLIFSDLFNRAFFRSGVDVSEVIFSKERTRAVEKADEEREMNIVPVEEGVAVMDAQHLRGLMLSVLRGDLGTSLSSIATALESDDSETAHYAASFLSDTLNDFRARMQEVYHGLKQELDLLKEEREKDHSAYEKHLAEAAARLQKEGNDFLYTVSVVLKQKVFTGPEQAEWTDHLAEVADGLYMISAESMSEDTYAGIAKHLMEAGRYKDCDIWTVRMGEEYQDSLSYYSLRLELFYRTHDNEAFFRTMEELKKSPVTVDSDTLTKIRMFSTGATNASADEAERERERAEVEQAVAFRPHEAPVVSTEAAVSAEPAVPAETAAPAEPVPYNTSVAKETTAAAIAASAVTAAAFAKATSGQQPVAEEKSVEKPAAKPAPVAAEKPAVKPVPVVTAEPAPLKSDLTFGDRVYTLGAFAYTGNESIEKVVLPASLRTVATGAFEDCRNLKTVIIPAGVAEIGPFAFMNTGLTSITIPASVQNVEEGAFSCCSRLTDVYVEGIDTAFGDRVFERSRKVKIHGAGGSRARRYAEENGISFTEENKAS